MDTVRVNICYRPLRICWAINAGDFAAFRRAVRTTITMWGGRFNPIAIVDRPEEADRIVEVFRADIIVPVGAGDSGNIVNQSLTVLLTRYPGYPRHR